LKVGSVRKEDGKSASRTLPWPNSRGSNKDVEEDGMVLGKNKKAFEERELVIISYIS